METITDNDLKMFQERAKTEFASRCDTGGIAWDSVIWDLCNEVRRLRGVSKESGNAAKLREALNRLVIASEGFLKTHSAKYYVDTTEALDKAKAAIAAPPRNCDRFASAEEAWDAYDEWVESYRAQGKTEPFNEFGWLFAPATEKEGGAK